MHSGTEDTVLNETLLKTNKQKNYALWWRENHEKAHTLTVTILSYYINQGTQAKNISVVLYV